MLNDKKLIFENGVIDDGCFSGAGFGYKINRIDMLMVYNLDTNVKLIKYYIKANMRFAIDSRY